MADSKKSSELDSGFEEIPLDKGFQEVPVSEEDNSAPQSPMLTSAAEGLAAGGTFGFGPRIGAAMGAGLEKIAGPPQDTKLSDLYNEYLDAAKKRQTKAEKSHPVVYKASELAGALASPLNVLAGPSQLPADAGILAKMGQGFAQGRNIGAAMGVAQSPDLTNIPQTANSAMQGATIGAIGGTAAPVIGAGLKTGANIVGTGLKSVFGPVGQMATTGAKAGMDRFPNLATEGGQAEATQMRGEFADNFVDDLNNILKSTAKNKRQLIASALENNQMAPEEAVQAVTQKYLDADPMLNDPKAREELSTLKEMIITAREGALAPKTVREYGENAPERSLPNDESQYMPGAVEREGQTTSDSPEFGTSPNNQLMSAEEEPVTNPSSPMGESAMPETPGSFAGYEALHKATVDADDDEARALFQQKVHEKLADEKALGQNHNDNPVQTQELPIPGTNKVRLIAKRAVTEEEPDAFQDQAANLNQKQREDQRLQALLDQQQEMSARLKQQQEADMAKPQFQDTEQMMREGGRNLQDPEQLYQLYKNLQSKSQFSEGRGFSTQEMNQMSGQAAKDIAQIIKQSVPGTQPLDQKLNAFNNIAERLGIDTDKLNLPGGEGEKAQADAMKKLLRVINPESTSDTSTVDKDAVNYIGNELDRIDPEAADNFRQQIDQHAESKGLIKEFSKPYEPGGINWLFNALRRNASRASYGAGHAVGTEIAKTEPLMNNAQKIFSRYTPDALQGAASKAMSSTDSTVQQLGQVLSKLATADDRTRNSMMFVLQQNPGYRQMMVPLFPTEQTKTPQAKDVTLEKYK